MEIENEDITSQNDDSTQEAENLETDNSENDLSQLSEKNKQLFARAKKAEEEAKLLKQKLESSKTATKTELNEDEIYKRIESKVEQKLMEKELENLNLSDELKEEVKSYAKLKNVSIKNAVESPYLKFRQRELETKAKEEEASASSGHKTTTRDYRNMDFKDFDLTTEEGRKSYEEWKNVQKKS